MASRRRRRREVSPRVLLRTGVRRRWVRATRFATAVLTSLWLLVTGIFAPQLAAIGALGATVILDLDGTLPDTYTEGNWPRATFNSGKFRFTWTPSAANSDAAWGSGFYCVMASSGTPSGTDQGGLWITSDALELYNQTGIVFSRALTWSAGATLTITIDQATGSLTVSGASSGNGTTSYTPSGTCFTAGTLGVGIYGGGGFGLPSSVIGDIDDGNDGITGTGTPAVPAVTASGAGAVALAGTGTPAVPAVTSGGTGTVAIAGTASATIPAVTSSGSGAAALVGTGSPTIDPITSSGSGAASGGLAGTGSPVVPEVTGTGAGQLSIGGTAAAALGAFASAGDGVLTLTGTGAPTVPAVTGAGTGAVALAGTGSPTIAAVTASGTGSSAVTPTAGAYDAQRVLYGTAAGTVTTESLTTINGSTFVIVTGGNLGDLTTAPTDNKGNTYTQLGAAEEFDRWAGYGLALWICVDGVGGGGHTFSQQFGQTAGFDEMTIAAFEARDAHHVQGYAITQALTGAALNFGSITTAAAAVLPVFFCGDAPTGSTTSVSLSNGYTVVDTDTLPDHPNGYVPIAIGYAEKSAPGAYGTTATESPDQGAIMVHVALQYAEGRLGVLTATLPAVTSSGSGALTSAGQLGATLAPITGSGSGALALVGTGGAAVPDVTSAGAGVVAIAGTGGGSLGALAGAGAGALGLAGTGSPAVPTITGAGAGTAAIAGAGGGDLGAVTGAGTGQLAIAGAGLLTLAPITGAGTGEGDGTLGTGSPAVGDVGGSGAGAVVIAGTSSATVSPVIAGASGALSIAGTGSAAVGAITLVATSAGRAFPSGGRLVTASTATPGVRRRPRVATRSTR